MRSICRISLECKMARFLIVGSIPGCLMLAAIPISSCGVAQMFWVIEHCAGGK
jgi:hypothetical protein